MVNFLDLISRFGVIGKSEIGRGVCWVSEIITVSNSVTGSEQELVWLILVFLTKLGSSWKLLFVFLFSLIFYLSSASSIWFLAVISESNFLSILLIMSYPHPLICSHFNSFHVTDLLLYPPENIRKPLGIGSTIYNLTRSVSFFKKFALSIVNDTLLCTHLTLYRLFDQCKFHCSPTIWLNTLLHRRTAIVLTRLTFRSVQSYTLFM